jgi:hypothetical protein
MIEYTFVESTHALAVLRARKRCRRDLSDRSHLGELRGGALLDRVQDEVAFVALACTSGAAEKVDVCNTGFSPCSCSCMMHNALTLLVVLRQPDLEHMRHALNIDATNEDVRGKHDVPGRIPKVLCRLVPLFL